MKKIIIPFEGANFATGAFSFAKSLHETEPILLAGVFLSAIDYSRFFLFPTAVSSEIYIPVGEVVEEEYIEANISRFKESCEKSGIEYRVHKDLYDSTMPQLSKETRFADLMILGSEIFYNNGIAFSVMDNVKKALHHTECPVIIVPEEFNFPSDIILAYDGSASSVFAIKEFANLFPKLCNGKTTLLYAGNMGKDIPDEQLIEELASRHFKELALAKLMADSKRSVREWFRDHGNALIVSGSFGRSRLSELFRESFVMGIIKEYKTPVFIAHK